MDATTCSSRSNMKSNCNGWKDNKVNSIQAEILRDAGRTMINMVTLDGVTIEGARGLIDVMIRALEVGRFSKFSSINRISVSRFDESVNLITDKDVHRCKACGETGTLSPQLWNKLS